jgi:hypothetical protein
MTLNPDDFIVINPPRFTGVVDAYVKGDKLAIMLIENSLNLIADLGYLRSGDYEGEDYLLIRTELDEYTDAMEAFFKHFNIKPLLQEHEEGHLENLSEQTFDDNQCSCGNCTCGGGGGGGGEGIIIQFPGSKENNS